MELLLLLLHLPWRGRGWWWWWPPPRRSLPPRSPAPSSRAGCRSPGGTPGPCLPAACRLRRVRQGMPVWLGEWKFQSLHSAGKHRDGFTHHLMTFFLAIFTPYQDTVCTTALLFWGNTYHWLNFTSLCMYVKWIINLTSDTIKVPRHQILLLRLIITESQAGCTA